MTLLAFKNTLPSVLPRTICPFDLGTAFGPSTGQTLTTSGWAQLNSAQAVAAIGPGAFDLDWALSISALKYSAGNETYQFALMGSNDPNFGNGNCDLLGFADYAAAASGRVVPNILAPTGASAAGGVVIPDPQNVGTFDVMPFRNYKNGYTYKNVGLYVTLGGTAPSVTFASWVNKDMNAC